MRSPVATSAALRVPCGKYLAVITEPDEDQLVAGYLVQPASFRPLPDTFLPILPCKIGSRETLVPDFDWPFEECHKQGQNIRVPSRSRQIRHDVILPQRRKNSHDTNKQLDVDHARQLATKAAEREADNVPDDVSQWTTFSGNNTCVLAPPGQFFAPDWASGLISYDISSLEEVLPPSRCFKDTRDIKNPFVKIEGPLLAPDGEDNQLEHDPAQRASPSLDPPVEQPSIDLTTFTLDLCVSFDRPRSPDRQATSEPPDNDDDDDDSDDDWIPTRRVCPKL
ncbi:hypothetical protein DFH08DRAFT_933879 [Mycena albidolilacea]|uniref:Uncharacterized protein n=1 Tax=Mycena albidolilacea TaxID=1033008 RepID=A0AAD7ACJ9_9AGAR|nr:hypothetical protein DFH08DRAFT_933879 [Mycena albidolilacea]